MVRLFLLAFLVVWEGWGQFVPQQFIVELSEERTGPLGERLSRVRAKQQGLERNLTARGFRTMGSVARVANALMVESGGDDAMAMATLRSLPGVVRVSQMRLFHKSLDSAAIIHGASEIWQRSGIGKAGAGIKVGVIDSGIEIKHPGFQDETLPRLEGYPKVNDPADLVHTNRKVIVARSYVSLLSRPDPDPSALDKDGHGTAVAMAAAGARHTAPNGVIAGMAPAAYLGVYKVFGTTGVNDSATDAAILKAIEDSVNDGMDVINLSLGSSLVQRAEDDVIVRALERAVEAGVIVVVAAGNSGPGPLTIGSPGIAPSAITVGANENGRFFASALLVGGLTIEAALGSNTPASGEVEGQLVNVETVDPTSLACGALPSGSLTGRIVLVQRGTCTFELKNQHVARAGGVALVLYSGAAQPNDFISPDTGSAPLPTMFLRRVDGLAVKTMLSETKSLAVKLDFSLAARPRDFRRVASFSSRGPLPIALIKPDLLAVGTLFYTAAQTNFSRGDIFSPSGYALIQGTSFSAPVVAGLAAALKSLRPGLKPADYRSLLIGSARALDDEAQAPVITTGAGLADLARAVDSPLRLSPPSLAFTAREQTIEVRSLGSTAAEYSVAVEVQAGKAPVVSQNTISIAPGAAATLRLSLDLSTLNTGLHMGALVFRREGTVLARAPYFFGNPNAGDIADVQSVLAAVRGRAGVPQRNLIFFRILDSNGLVVEQTPRVRVVTGLAEVRAVEWRDSEVLGAYGLDLLLGPGTNVIEVNAGNGVTRRFTILGQ
ncbi:MAG: S8 family serine peptidase [Acidobacteriota bacterium]